MSSACRFHCVTDNVIRLFKLFCFKYLRRKDFISDILYCENELIVFYFQVGDAVFACQAHPGVFL